MYALTNLHRRNGEWHLQFLFRLRFTFYIFFYFLLFIIFNKTKIKSFDVSPTDVRVRFVYNSVHCSGSNVGNSRPTTKSIFFALQRSYSTVFRTDSLTDLSKFSIGISIFGRCSERLRFGEFTFICLFLFHFICLSPYSTFVAVVV